MLKLWYCHDPTCIIQNGYLSVCLGRSRDTWAVTTHSWQATCFRPRVQSVTHPGSPGELWSFSLLWRDSPSV